MSLTLCEIAKRVKRQVQVPVVEKDKPKLNPVTKVPLTEVKKEEISEDDILDHRIDVGSGHVVVITTDGQRLTGELTKAQLEKLQKAQEKTAAASTNEASDDKQDSDDKKAADTVPQQDKG